MGSGVLKLENITPKFWHTNTMLSIARALRPTARATRATLRGARVKAMPLHRSINIDNSSCNSSRSTISESSTIGNSSSGKLGWHDVGGDRGLLGERLEGIEPGRVEPPIAHWEKRAHALLGILVAKCVSTLHRIMH